MRAILGLVASACMLFVVGEAGAQGITTNPRPPSRPSATRMPAKTLVAMPKAEDAPPSEESAAAGDSSSASEPEAKPDAEPKKPPPLTPHIEVHGGAWLFYYQPFDIPGEREFIRLHFAHINFDGSIGDFGLFFNASVRDTKMRDFYAGPAWLEEAYFYYKNRYLTLKAGKVYNRFGLFWDNSFYGNVHFYDGIKLDPNVGLSLEGSAGAEKGFRLGYYAQYFLLDGRTNGSYTGRDTISVPGAFRRHNAVLRAEPAYFWDKETSLILGLSGQYFRADIPEPVGKKHVFRFGADVTVNVGPVSVWGDAARQIGQSVVAHPIAATTEPPPGSPGRASAHNDYLLAGGELRIWKFVARYNLSLVRYNDANVIELLNEPAIGFNLNDNIQFLVEYAHWTRELPDGTIQYLDRSLNTTIHGYF